MESKKRGVDMLDHGQTMSHQDGITPDLVDVEMTQDGVRCQCQMTAAMDEPAVATDMFAVYAFVHQVLFQVSRRGRPWTATKRLEDSVRRWVRTTEVHVEHQVARQGLVQRDVDRLCRLSILVVVNTTFQMVDEQDQLADERWMFIMAIHHQPSRALDATRDVGEPQTEFNEIP